MLFPKHIDAAEIYNNEAEVGEALQAAMEKGAAKREELFVTSKLWNTDHASKQRIPSAMCRPCYEQSNVSIEFGAQLRWLLCMCRAVRLHPQGIITGTATQQSSDAVLMQIQLLMALMSDCCNPRVAAEDRVHAACMKSLKSLKLTYLDLYLIHWPATGNHGPQASAAEGR